MRVLLITSLERGGPVEQALQLASGLVRRGIAVRAICATDSVAERFSAAGAASERLSLRPGIDGVGAVKLWRRLRSADVVHAEDRRSGLWTRLAPRFSASQVRVYTVHGLPDAYLPEPLGLRQPSFRDRIAYEGVDAILCRRADAVIIPSMALAAIFRDRLGFPAELIRVVPNGVDVPASADHQGDEVGTLSLLEPVKGLTTFLDAVAILAPVRPLLRFAIFGEGSQRRALERRAHELEIADRVTFAGHVDQQDALRRLAVLVLPSVFEAAPMALLEAMAAGIPVVASRTGGIPEIAGEDTALMVDPGDAAGVAHAITRLLDDAQLAKSRAAAGRDRIESRFTAETNVDRTVQVYASALTARRRR